MIFQQEKSCNPKGETPIAPGGESEKGKKSFLSGSQRQKKAPIISREHLLPNTRKKKEVNSMPKNVLLLRRICLLRRGREKKKGRRDQKGEASA